MKLVYRSITALLLLAGTGSYAQFTGKPTYEIEVRQSDTLMGKIAVEMFPAIAPNHVRNWDSLVAIKFYDSIAFHRVIADFMIQGGDPNSKNKPMSTWGTGGSGTRLDAEFNAVSHQPGILSAARLGNDVNSATSQFFICVADDSFLDRQYTVYGQAVSGLDVAVKVSEVLTDGTDHPVDKITMFITKTGSNDAETAVPEHAFPLKDTSLAATTKSVTFRWHPVASAMMYRLQVANDPAFTSLHRDTTISQMDTSIRLTGFQNQRSYHWRILANNGGRPSEYSAPWSFVIGTLSVTEDKHVASLDGAAPNPVVDRSTIRFTLANDMRVNLSLLDMLGRKVRTILNDDHREAGSHNLTVDVAGLVGGVYLLVLEADGRTLTKQLVVE